MMALNGGGCDGRRRKPGTQEQSLPVNVLRLRPASSQHSVTEQAQGDNGMARQIKAKQE